MPFIRPRLSLISGVLALVTGMSASLWATPPADPLAEQALAVAGNTFKGGDIYDRLLAAGILAETGNAEALDFIARYLRMDDLVLKRAAIDTLIASSHPQELDLLFRTASEQPEVMGLLMESLAATPRPDMGDLIAEALREGSAYVRKNAIQAIARGRVAGLQEALDLLVDDETTHETVRAYAYYALLATGAGQRITPRLLALGDSTQVEEREVAAIAMGLLPPATSGKALLKLMTDRSDERVSLAAMASAAGQGNDEAIGRMIQGVAYGKPMESTVLAGAIKRLPATTAAQMTEVLMTCCKLKADAATRVVESWSTIDADAMPVYRWGLAHAEPDVRLQTAWLIGHRRDEAALPLLAPLLESEDPGLRTMAAWSVMQCKAEGG